MADRHSGLWGVGLAVLVLGLVSCRLDREAPLSVAASGGEERGAATGLASLLGQYQGTNPQNGQSCFVWIETRDYQDEKSAIQNKTFFAYSGDFGSRATPEPRDLYLEVTREFAALRAPQQSVSPVTVDLAGLVDGSGRVISGPRTLKLVLESEGDQLKKVTFEHQKTKPCMWPWKPVPVTEMGICEDLRKVIHSSWRGASAGRPPLGTPLLRSKGTPLPDKRPRLAPPPGPGHGPGSGPRPEVAPRPEGTHYGVLGVPRDATADDIRKAYHRLMLKYHPDKIQGSEVDKERLKAIAQKINAAYEILGDPEKRAVYDRQMRSS